VSRQSTKLAALLITTALITSACGIGFNAGTNQQQASGNGRSADIGSIQVRGALIVIDPKKPGWGTFVGTIINTAPEQDKFLGLVIDSAPNELFESPDCIKDQKVCTLKTQDPKHFGLPKQLSLPIKLNPDVHAGTFVKVQLVFENTQPITFQSPKPGVPGANTPDLTSLLVENNDGIYSDIVVHSTEGIIN